MGNFLPKLEPAILFILKKGLKNQYKIVLFLIKLKYHKTQLLQKSMNQYHIY